MKMKLKLFLFWLIKFDHINLKVLKIVMEDRIVSHSSIICQFSGRIITFCTLYTTHTRFVTTLKPIDHLRMHYFLCKTLLLMWNAFVWETKSQSPFIHILRLGTTYLLIYYLCRMYKDSFLEYLTLYCIVNFSKKISVRVF